MTDQLVHNGTIIEHGQESPHSYSWKCSCGSQGRRRFKERFSAVGMFRIHADPQPYRVDEETNNIPNTHDLVRVLAVKSAWVNTMIVCGNDMASKLDPNDHMVEIWHECVRRYNDAPVG